MNAVYRVPQSNYLAASHQMSTTTVVHTTDVIGLGVREQLDAAWMPNKRTTRQKRDLHIACP